MSLEKTVSTSSRKSVPEHFQYSYLYIFGQYQNTSVSVLLKSALIPLPASWTVPYYDCSYTEAIFVVLHFLNKKFQLLY